MSLFLYGLFPVGPIGLIQPPSSSSIIHQAITLHGRPNADGHTGEPDSQGQRGTEEQRIKGKGERNTGEGRRCMSPAN